MEYNFQTKMAIHRKKIKDKIYIYEFRKYYDQKEKRQKYDYNLIGYEIDNIFIPKELDLFPKRVFSFREYVFLEILKKLKVVEHLKAIFRKRQWEKIIILAINKLLEPLSLKNIEDWTQSSILSEIFKDVGLSHNNLSQFFNNFDIEKIFLFFHALNQEKEVLLVDTTRIFQKSKNNPLLDYGYNSKKLREKQMVLFLALDLKTKLPAFYIYYPGNVNDKQTIQYFFEMAKKYCKNAIIILDRGFASKKAIRFMLENNINFIIPIPRNFKAFWKEILNEKLENYFEYRDRIIFYDKKQISIDNNFIIYAYLFEDYILKGKQLRSYAKRFRDKEVSDKKEILGKILFLSNLDFNPEEVYMLYKARDFIEKGFKTLKSIFEIDFNYLRDIKSQYVLLFILLIALMIRQYVLERVRDHGLTFEDVKNKLRKLFVIKTRSNHYLLPAIPKDVKEILNLLGVKLQEGVVDLNME